MPLQTKFEAIISIGNKLKIRSLKKTNELINDTTRHPFEGIDKPESLKHKYSGFYSRRTDDKHRLIYTVIDDELQIAKCRYYYG